MRIGSASAYLEIGAECGLVEVTPIQSDSFKRVAIQVFKVEVSLTGTMMIPVEISTGTRLLGRSYRTSAVGHKVGIAGTSVIGPESFLFCSEGRYLLKLLAGIHQFSLNLWSGEHHPFLEDWLGEQGEVGLISASVENAMARSDLRYREVLDGDRSWNDLALLSWLIEAVPRVVGGDGSTTLATLSEDIPGVLKGIAERVLADPIRHWSVPEAAHLAGYSSFHFSRVFKQKVGVGFQEFVDRCRTDMALKLLCRTSEPVEAIAEKCGFGSPQTLRDSLRSYLGLMPSDIRFSPERIKN